MHSTSLFSALLAGTASALSLPPLIPSIPGVTDPLATNAPPLPILQIPTPPLESPPFVGNQNLKPKKIGYFWTASGDNNHKDFLATYSLDDDTFGTLLWVTDVPSSGNSPHHLGPSLDGKTLVGGGLLSLLKTQDTAYYFDTGRLIVNASDFVADHCYSQSLPAEVQEEQPRLALLYHG